jgi:hypothetical protein
MDKHGMTLAATVFGALALVPLGGGAALTPAASPSAATNAIEQVQYWRGPGWQGGWHGGWHGWYGRPYWFARPWARRPYYGTIIAGVALGAIITVAAVGMVPPRPAPDLCWYWADPYRSRGYWDYCY